MLQAYRDCPSINMTAQVKTSLVCTSNFANSKDHKILLKKEYKAETLSNKEGMFDLKTL